MNNKIWSYFEIAGKLATKQRDGRKFFLGAIGIRSSDGAIVKSVNGSYQTDEPLPVGHAEIKCLKKLTPGSIMYVARVRIGDGTFGMAKPCKNCEQALRFKGIKKVYYTISPNEFGTLYL